MEECAAQADCEHCPIRHARETLSETDLQALDAFDLLGRRIVMEFRLAPLVFEALGLRFRSRAEARRFVEKLDLIYDLRYPVKTHTHG